MNVVKTEKKMSRSYRKTPIFGITTAESEKEDKKLWHKSFRTKAKNQLKEKTLRNDIEELDTIIDVHEYDVSNSFAMDKEVKKYYPKYRQVFHAKKIADRIGKTVAEKSALQLRYLQKHKFK